MKTTLNLIPAGILMAALLLSTFSCQKNNNDNGTQTADEATAVSLATLSTGAESLYDDAFDVVAQSSEQTDVSTNSTSGLTINSTSLAASSNSAVACATVTLAPADPSVFPKTMTIDYGSGCTSVNGVTRKGKLTVTLTGKARSTGTVISVAFDNYSVNGYMLAGTYSLTPVIVSGGGVNYNVTVTGGSISSPSGAVYAYSGTETFTQTAGIATPEVTDDTYEITGNFSYSGNGNSISGTVTTPLVRSADCPNVTSGIIAFVYKNISGTLDFGSGTCDNLATVKAGLTTKTITLPR